MLIFMNNRIYKRDKNTLDFLLSYFSKDSGYEEKEVNGFWLIKQLNKLQNMWNVAIYTKESYSNKKKHQEQFKGKRYKVTRRNRR